MPGEQQRKVVGEDARMVHDADAHALQRRGLGLGDPEGLDVGQEPFTELEFHAKHGQVFAGIAGEDHAFFEFPPRHGDFVDVQDVGKLRQAGVGPDVDAGEGHAEIEIERAAQVRQFLIERSVIKRCAHVHRDIEDDGHGGRELVPRRAGAGLGAGRGRERLGEFLFGVRGLRGFVDALEHIAEPAEEGRQREQLRLGEAGDEGEEEHQPARHEQRLGLGEYLEADLRAHVVVGIAGAGDQDARRNGDEQRGDLGYQPVADGEDAVGVQGVPGGHAVLGDADDRAAHDIHDGDDHPGDGVAFYELHGAVHGAVHLAFLADALAAALRLLHVDDSGAHVGVDGHLLAGHSVEGEAGPDFGHALRAFGYDKELHDGQDEEDHRADHEVAAKGEFAEREDDFARVRLKQDEARGRDVEAHPEQGGEQEQRGKDREVQHRPHVHGHHQDGEGQGHVHADERIHHRRGQRDDHQRDDGDEQEDDVDVVVARDHADGGTGRGEQAHTRLPMPLKGGSASACADGPLPARYRYSLTAALASSLRPCCQSARARSRCRAAWRVERVCPSMTRCRSWRAFSALPRSVSMAASVAAALREMASMPSGASLSSAAKTVAALSRRPMR